MLKKIFALAALAVVALMPTAKAEDAAAPAKKPGILKEAGSELKKGAGAVVKGSEAVVKDGAKAVEKGAKLVGKGTVAGVKGTETLGKDLVKGTETAGKDVVKGTEKVGAGAEGLVKHKKKDAAPATGTDSSAK